MLFLHLNILSNFFSHYSPILLLLLFSLSSILSALSSLRHHLNIASSDFRSETILTFFLLWEWLVASESRIYSFYDKKGSYLPSTLSKLRNAEASGHACCYQTLRPNWYIRKDSPETCTLRFWIIVPPPPSPLPRLSIFWNFSTREIFIPTPPPFINFENFFFFQKNAMLSIFYLTYST